MPCRHAYTACLFVRTRLSLLQNNALNRNVKPALLSVFGDLAMALGASFDGYLDAAFKLLAQAATLEVDVRCTLINSPLA